MEEENFNVCDQESDYLPESPSELPLVLRRKENYVRLTSTRSSTATTDRIVTKHGRTNISLTKIPNKELRYIRDLGNTLIHIRWRWILLTLALVNSLAYLAFSGIWMLTAWMDGDINPIPTHQKCVMGADRYVDYLLLSIETITTTGYGYFYPSDDCTLAWLVLTLSTVVVIVIDGAFFTVVYVKITRPVSKDVVRFSKKAVICLRDGNLCLVFRVSDRHGKHWIRTQVKAYVVTHRMSHEGESLTNYMEPLTLETCGLMLWPVDVVHRITDSSPFWNASADDLMAVKFEVMVVVNGDSISSGQPSQSQASYVSREILWGYRFEPCLEIEIGKPHYVVDYELFNRVTPFDTPLCSAKDLHRLEKFSLGVAERISL